jgi:hypothetical protein
VGVVIPYIASRRSSHQPSPAEANTFYKKTGVQFVSGRIRAVFGKVKCFSAIKKIISYSFMEGKDLLLS